MPALLPRLRQRFPRAVLIWAGLTLVFALAVLASLSHLAAVPAHETIRANSEQQRVIIDPVTGIVAGLNNATETAPFDVGDAPQAEPDATTPSETTEENAPAAAPEAENAPVEPVAEQAAAPSSEATGDASSFAPLVRNRRAVSIPLVPRSSESLVNAPAPEISEKVGKELLPREGEGQLRAATLYGKAFTRASADQHMVSIVVTDVGFNGEIAKRVMALPTHISIAVSPYAEDVTAQIQALRNSGHEVWTQLPVMGARYPQDDPGPLGLINVLTIKSAIARLRTLMATTIGSVGFILPADETLSTYADVWTPIYDEIDERGLNLLSTHPKRNAKDLGATTAQAEHFRRADIILDSTPGAAFMRSKLAGIAELAKAQPELIVLVSARPQTLALLEEWLANDPLAEVARFAPLSALYVPYTAPPAPVEVKAEGGGHGGGDAKKEESSGGH